ncbi:hypothetical protein MMC20_002686 [Loxospora ochrophaea]|nr:hypothetical protein [Loxospora ochrophaea]
MSRGLDDWVIIVALVFSVANAVNVLYGAIRANLGQHMPLTPSGLAELGPKLTALEKMAYASEPIVTVAIGLARWSLLLFYAKLFAVPSFHIPVWTMYTLNGIWTVAFTLAYIFQCSTPSKLWTEQEGAMTGCINGPISNKVYAISSIILDVLVLSMPWPMVGRLQMALRQKIAVLGIFMLGAIIVAVSIGKCYAFFTVERIIAKNHDLTYDLAPVFYWTVPESCLSVVCASLPTLRPLFHGISPESLIRSVRGVFSLHSIRSRDTRASDHSNSKSSKSYSANLDDKYGESTVGFRPLGDDEEAAAYPRVAISSGGSPVSDTKNNSIAMQDLRDTQTGGIRVQKEFRTVDERV